MIVWKGKRLLQFRNRSDVSRVSSGDSGASLIEAAFALPIFIIFVLLIIDVARYFFVSMVLNYAASQGVDVASKLRIEIPTHNSHCRIISGDASSIQRYRDCQRFLGMFDQVVNHTLSLADVAVGSNRVTLLEVEHYKDADYDSNLEPWTGISDERRFAGFLRPGEAVRIIAEDGVTELGKFSHPIRRDANFDPSLPSRSVGWPDPAKGEQWENILQNAPIAVHLEAHFYPITPIFSSLASPIRISVTQFAFRKGNDIGVSDPGDSSSFTPPPTQTSTPSLPPHLVPTFTPSRIPTPTYTPTRTNTPTETATPTETSTPTLSPTITLSPTSTTVPTITPTQEHPFIPTGAPNPTNTLSPTITQTPADSATVTVTFTPLESTTVTETPLPTSTATPSGTPTVTHSPTPTIDCFDFNPCSIDPCACVEMSDGATPEACDKCDGSAWGDCWDALTCGLSSG